MKRTNFDGILNISGGEYEELYIDGICNVSTDLKAQVLDLDGILNCSGSVDAQTLDCDGVANIKGNIRSEVMKVDGVINVGSKSKPTRIEADEIHCNGVISCTGVGEISADLVDAEGFIKASEIVGERVLIRSKRSILMRWLQDRFSKVDTIEATTIELHGVSAQTVNGQDIHIGPECIIERLDCSGKLYIDPAATVRSITGTYTRV